MSIKELIEKIRNHEREARVLQGEMWFGWLIDIYHKRQKIPSILEVDETKMKDDLNENRAK